jgi:hypothetical protein
MLTTLIGLTTGAGSVWIATQAIGLLREWSLLQRVRAAFTADQKLASTISLEHSSPAAGIETLGTGWAVLRVQDLSRLRASGIEAAARLSRLDQQRATISVTVSRLFAGLAVLLGASGMLGPFLHISSRSASLAVAPEAISLPPAAWVCAITGIVGAFWLLLLGQLLGVGHQSFLARLDRFTLLELAQALLVPDAAGASERFASRLDESSRRLESAIHPLTEKLGLFDAALQSSMSSFAPRLENASHNLLQAVEDMRQSAADLRQGTDSFATNYARVASVYAGMEQLAGRVAGSQAGQQERLSEIAAGLHGITESLTTVVASANESQEAVGRMARTVSGAAAGMEGASRELQTSVDRLALGIKAGAAQGPSMEGVTLRCLVEQQERFINLLDHRLGRVDGGGRAGCQISSSSSRSSSRSSSSSSSSSTASKEEPVNALSAQAT